MLANKWAFPAKDVREQAAAWLMRISSADCTIDDREQFDAWLNASEFHRASYWRLEAAWIEAARLAALRPTKPEGNTSGLFSKPAFFRTIAATLIICVGAAAGLYLDLKSSTQTYATAVGGYRVLTLPDGSSIELNTDTAVKVADDRSQRTVWLDKGEAFFRIKHDAARPFVVIVGDQAVTDLGTEFTIRRISSRVEVALLEGRAQFETIGHHAPFQSAELSRGEVAVAHNGMISVARKPIANLSNGLGWRNGLLIFDETTLTDAALEFNRYNAGQIIIGNSSIARLRVNGTFPIHARREFADVATAIFGLRVETRGDETIISR